MYIVGELRTFVDQDILNISYLLESGAERYVTVFSSDFDAFCDLQLNTHSKVESICFRQ